MSQSKSNCTDASPGKYVFNLLSKFVLMCFFCASPGKNVVMLLLIGLEMFQSWEGCFFLYFFS